jgi:hypothetical protein
MPVAVKEVRGIELGVHVRGRILDFAASIILLLFLFYRRAPLWLKGATLTVAIGALFALSSALMEAWPLEQRDISLARFALAVVALCVLLRERVAGAFEASRPVLLWCCPYAACSGCWHSST